MGETADRYGMLLDQRNMANRAVVVDKDGLVTWMQAEQQLMATVPNYDPILACLGG